MNRKAVILHVGANKNPKYLGKLGPIFRDGTFKLIPIPETPGLGGPSYRDLGLADYVPSNRVDDPAHPDPEFKTFTYGDRPEFEAKMRFLLKLKTRDYLFFLASLRYSDLPEQRLTWINLDWSYYLIGYLEIQRIMPVPRVTTEIRGEFGNNAHVNINDENFMLFVGSEKSALLNKGVPFSNGRYPNALSLSVFRNLRPNSVGRWWQGFIERDALRILWKGVDEINPRQSVIAGFSNN